MKRYRLIYRGIRDTYYCFDTQTNKRETLGTGSQTKAQRLIDAKNEAVQHAEMNLQIAQVYLQQSDPTLAKRTWQEVMEAMTPLKNGPTLIRWDRGCLSSFTRNCVGWRPARWPGKRPARHCNPRNWCMRRGCDWWAPKTRNLRIATISFLLPPRPCAAS